MEGAGWRVTLDVVHRPSEVYKAAKEQGGYLITHVGRVEKADGSAFAPADGEQVLEGFGWFLSFACGRWTHPPPVGFDGAVHAFGSDGRPCGSRPGDSCIGGWTTITGTTLPGHFRGSCDAGKTRTGRSFHLAVHWYVEANAQAGSMEGSIVLTQTAFEMLAAAVIVEENGWVSTDGWEKLPAADRIRLMFGWAALPLEIPANQTELKKLAAELNWKDAPQAMTEMRNPLTHPTPKNRRRLGGYPLDARSEAWNLGLWFLELCVLRLCEYRGTYGCRLATRYAGEVVPVPWAASRPTPAAAGPAVPRVSPVPPAN